MLVDIVAVLFRNYFWLWHSSIDVREGHVCRKKWTENVRKDGANAAKGD